MNKAILKLWWFCSYAALLLKECSLSAHCSIEVLAYGANSGGTTRNGYVKLNASPVWQASWFGEHRNLRGVNVIAVDPFQCSLLETRRFDTFGEQNAATELRTYLQKVKRGGIIVVVSADEASHHLSSALPTLTSMGAHVTDVQHRGAFGFVAQKGFPAKTVLRKALTETASNDNQPHFSVAISGGIYCRSNSCTYTKLSWNFATLDSSKCQ